MKIMYPKVLKRFTNIIAVLAFTNSIHVNVPFNCVHRDIIRIWIEYDYVIVKLS